MKEKGFIQRMYNRFSSANGFTLVEILIVTVIVVILVGILSFALLQARSVFLSSDVLAALQADTRIALNRMAADLRRTSLTQMSITQDTPSAGTDTIIYHLPLDNDSDGVPDIVSDVLVWDADNIEIGLDVAESQLEKAINGTVVAVLANNVKKINFLDHTLDATLYLDELKIVMELEKTTIEGRTHNFVSTSIINMRN